MAEQRDLLVEIGTEELPPKSLSRLAYSLADGIRGGLDDAGLGYGEIEIFATPRRLGVLVHDVDAAQPDKQTIRRGPAVTAAFDEQGKPTKAALGFARSCGVDVDRLETLETDNGSWLAARIAEKGSTTPELIPGILEKALAALPIPKRMRWGVWETAFIRPVHWVVLLYGTAVVEIEILGVPSGRQTRGHRFLSPAPREIPEPTRYAAILEETGKVRPRFDKRRDLIEAQAKAAAASLGGNAVLDPELLDEVAALVEWPIVFTGHFNATFLSMPPEVLIATLKDHQKYFHVLDAHGRLMPAFIGVCNIEPKDLDTVRHGNERVVNPRLADAQFFWDQDRRQPLGQRLETLRGVVFQEKLGTLYDKSQRVGKLAAFIAARINGDPKLAARAAELSKCDLVTDMVGEFPALQGTMGRYYAIDSGEKMEVAQALEEQYRPRFAGDETPQTPTGQALAIADKLDTLVGIFGIGQAPTGDKDPFGLRRAALGVLRIIIERQLPLDLSEILQTAANNFDKVLDVKTTPDPVFDFMLERLRRYYLDDGVAPDVFDAVSARRPTQPYDFDQRVRAVTAFNAMPEAQSLSAANKRVGNILKKAGLEPPRTIDEQLLREPAEQSLAKELVKVTAAIGPKLKNGNYTQALTELANLRDSVDRFFDSVMVMCDDQALRDNRLALLNNMNALFLRIADISRLQN